MTKLTNTREILIFYNPDSNADRRCVAHAKSISKHVKAFAFDKSASTEMYWQQILDTLKVHPKALMDKSTSKYQHTIRGKEFDAEGWMKVLRYNPDLLLAPIALRGNKGVVCYSPTDIYKLLQKGEKLPTIDE